MWPHEKQKGDASDVGRRDSKTVGDMPAFRIQALYRRATLNRHVIAGREVLKLLRSSSSWCPGATAELRFPDT